jgi:large subunit ribosomal protein L24
MKVLRNDTVQIIAGKDRGKRGRVRTVLPAKNKVVVENINVYKRHIKRGRARQTGIIEFEAPLQVSNVMVVCESCDKPTRVGHEFLEDGQKVRVCKKCQAVIERKIVVPRRGTSNG